MLRLPDDLPPDVRARLSKAARARYDAMAAQHPEWEAADWAHWYGTETLRQVQEQERAFQREIDRLMQEYRDHG